MLNRIMNKIENWIYFRKLSLRYKNHKHTHLYIYYKTEITNTIAGGGI